MGSLRLTPVQSSVGRGEEWRDRASCNRGTETRSGVREATKLIGRSWSCIPFAKPSRRYAGSDASAGAIRGEPPTPLLSPCTAFSRRRKQNNNRGKSRAFKYSTRHGRRKDPVRRPFIHHGSYPCLAYECRFPTLRQLLALSLTWQ